jgi:hypothetical protein
MLLGGKGGDGGSVRSKHLANARIKNWSSLLGSIQKMLVAYGFMTHEWDWLAPFVADLLAGHRQRLSRMHMSAAFARNLRRIPLNWTLCPRATFASREKARDT